MFFVRVKGTLHGPPHPDLASAKKAAAGHLLGRRAEKTAEIVPFVPGVIGGVGPAVATAKKNRSGVVVWTDVALEE